MAAYCQQCGNALHGPARFCSSCGATVPVPEPKPSRPLIRPHAGRVIGGVCIGLSQAHDWDVTLVRILVVLGCFFSSGLVGVAYVAAWIGIPEEAVPYPGAYPPGI